MPPLPPPSLFLYCPTVERRKNSSLRNVGREARQEREVEPTAWATHRCGICVHNSYNNRCAPCLLQGCKWSCIAAITGNFPASVLKYHWRASAAAISTPDNLGASTISSKWASPWFVPDVGPRQRTRWPTAGQYHAGSFPNPSDRFVCLGGNDVFCRWKVGSRTILVLLQLPENAPLRDYRQASMRKTTSVQLRKGKHYYCRGLFSARWNLILILSISIARLGCMTTVKTRAPIVCFNGLRNNKCAFLKWEVIRFFQQQISHGNQVQLDFPKA